MDPGTDGAIWALIQCNPTELHRATANGGRTMDALYTACVASRLASPGLTSIEDRYVAVFDSALKARLGCWVVDYVELVCGDPHLTSNDPLDAYLLDGQFVKAWAARAIAAVEVEVHAVLHSDSPTFADSAASGQLPSALSRCHALIAVLQALQGIQGSTGSGVQAELQHAQLMTSCLQALLWCVQHRLHQRPNTGRYASYAEWAGRIAARRTASARDAVVAAALAGGSQLSDHGANAMVMALSEDDGRDDGTAQTSSSTLFIDSTLEHLKLPGAYPFASLSSAIHSLFVAIKDSSEEARAAKLSALLYYIMDVGWLTEEADLEDFRRSFNVASSQLTLWRCRYLLDCAEQTVFGEPGAVSYTNTPLSQACELLLACVPPDTPFHFIEVLLARGCADVALAVHRAQSAAAAAAAAAAGTESSARAGRGAAAGAGTSGKGQTRAPQSLRQASVLLELRLRCGLLTEAFTELRSYFASLPPADSTAATSASARGRDDGDTVMASGATAAVATSSASPRAAHVEALVTQLAEWALRSSDDGQDGGTPWMQRLVELPFNAEEEVVLVRWLLRRAEAGEAVGDHLPLFFVQRGRALEAVGAYNRWRGLKGNTMEASEAAREQAIGLLVDAAFLLLPEPMRNVSIDADPEAATLQHDTAGLVAGLRSNMDAQAPVMHAAFHRGQPPPFVLSRVPTADGTMEPGTATEVPPAAAGGSAEGGTGVAAAGRQAATAGDAAATTAASTSQSARPAIAFGVPQGGSNGFHLPGAMATAGRLPPVAPGGIGWGTGAPPQAVLREQLFGRVAATASFATAAGQGANPDSSFPFTPSAVAPPTTSLAGLEGRQLFDGLAGGTTPAAAGRTTLFGGVTPTAGGAGAGGGGAGAVPRSVKRPRTAHWLKA